MGRTNRKARRTPTQATADRHADDLASKLGRSLREGRQARRQTQAHFAAIAGISRSEWSHLEVARDGRTTLATWNRAATAVGTTFEAYLKQLSAADQPRDVVHLGHQELLIRTAAPGGWHGLPEEPIDREARTSRWGDVLLHRRLGTVDEYGLFEVFDWFDDVGAHTRDWLRRLDALERYAIARMRDDTLPRTSGCWIVRATARNRRLVAEHSAFFRSRFQGSGDDWLAALTSQQPMPSQPALLWVAVKGDRLYPSRHRT